MSIGFIIVIALILICCVVFWRYVALDATIKSIIIGAVILIVILILLGQLGGVNWGVHFGR